MPLYAPPATASDLVKIAEFVLGATTATMDFTAIPSTYSSLRLHFYGRGVDANPSVNLHLQCNGDTTANYLSQRLRGTGSTAAGFNYGAPAASAVIGNFPADGAASAFMADGVVIEVPNYRGTTFHKSIFSRSSSRTDDVLNGAQNADVFSTWWRNVAAITRLTLFPSTGSFASGTTATLYGLK